MTCGLIIAAIVWTKLIILFQYFIRPSRWYRSLWNTTARLIRWIRAGLDRRSVDYSGLVFISIVFALTCLGFIAKYAR